MRSDFSTRARSSGSSGNSQLDQGGLDTVTRADPFPPVPKEIPRDTFEAVVPIRFNID